MLNLIPSAYVDWDCTQLNTRHTPLIDLLGAGANLHCLCLDMLLLLHPRQLWNNSALCVFSDGLGSLAFARHYSHFGSRRGRGLKPRLGEVTWSFAESSCVCACHWHHHHPLCHLSVSQSCFQSASQTGTASCMKTNLSKWSTNSHFPFLAQEIPHHK